MEMFDKVTETSISEDGKAQVRTTREGKGEMVTACDKLVAAHRTFERLNADPRSVTDPARNLAWWHAMNKLAECERRVWRLFVGPHPTFKCNLQFIKWRRDFLEGKNI